MSWTDGSILAHGTTDSAGNFTVSTGDRAGPLASMAKARARNMTVFSHWLRQDQSALQ